MTAAHLNKHIFGTIGPRLWVALCLSILRADDAALPVWPASNSEADGVLWFWGHQNLTGEITDAEGNWARQGEAIFRGGARATWFHGVSPHNGYVEAADVGPALARSLESTPRIHLEAALHPPIKAGEPVVLFWLGTYEHSPIWQWMFRDGALWIERPDQDPVRMTELKLSAPSHLAVTLTKEKATVWLNGRKHAEMEAALLPAFEDPWDVIAAFGGAPDSNTAWTGGLEYLLIGTRPDAVDRHADAWRAAHRARTTPDTHSVTAILSAHAREVDENDLSDYSNSLLGSVWILKEGNVENLSEGDSFFTWHWYSLNSGLLPHNRPPPVGTTRSFRISPAEQQPQIEGIQQVIDGLDPGKTLLLPEYYILDSPSGLK